MGRSRATSCVGKFLRICLYLLSRFPPRGRAGATARLPQFSAGAVPGQSASRAGRVEVVRELLARGEKLDNLVDKSTDLSLASQMFYKQAKKQNQCCTMM